MTRRSRWLLVAVLLVGLATALLMWRRPQPAGAPEAQSGVTLARGGELVAALRNDPPTFNRYAPRGFENTVEALTLLLHAPLARINRHTGALELWLAERADGAADGLTYTLTLRDGVRWSDGHPFTSDDVVFSVQALYDRRLRSPIASAMLVGGKPITVSARDARTVVLTFPAPFGPGLRILENLPIFPKHKLEAALRAGTMGDAWGVTANPADVVGLGPFKLVSYTPAERVVVERNPHYFRKVQPPDGGEEVQLPYLDRLTIAIVRDQNTEVLRLQNGQIDIGAREIRPEDYATLRRDQERGRVKLVDAGVGLDPNMLWFNLSPGAYAGDPRKPWLQSEDFRKAISHAVDRRALVDQVYLGLAIPIHGPITPGNTEWYTADIPRYDYDPERARSLLRERLRFTDVNRDGMLEDAAGRPVRFSILSQQQDTIRMRSVSVIQQHLRQAGIAVDVVGLDSGALIQRFAASNYDAIYFGVESNSFDPANNMDLWLSSGSFHVWNPGQPSPATEWERRIDELMQHVIASGDAAERRRLFSQVQQIFAEHIPILYFATPRVVIALSPKVANANPAPLRPIVLWSADTLAVARR